MESSVISQMDGLVDILTVPSLKVILLSSNKHSLWFFVTQIRGFINL